MNKVFRPLADLFRKPGTGDYWQQVCIQRETGFGSNLDVGARYSLILAAGVVLTYALSSVIYIGWSAAYLVTNLTYRAVVFRQTAPVSARRYIALVAMEATSATIYAVMPVYLWLTSDEPSLKFIAVCGVAGQAMFNLARHHTRSLTELFDMVLVLICIAIFGAHQFFDAGSMPEKLIVAIGTLALLIYFTTLHTSTIRDRADLALSREREIEQQKMDAMGQITAGVAHDFNNILTALQGNLELAELTPDPSERSSLLKEARAAAQRAARVVSQMLVFVRKAPMRRQNVLLADLCDSLQSAAALELPNGTTLHIELSDPTLALQTDFALLESALMALITNARDAMAPDGGEIKISIQLDDLADWAGPKPTSSGPYIRFDVLDRGSGIPDHMIKTVREPYFTTKPTGSGSGLGLAVVQGFADQMGGVLSLRNRAKGGLVATVVLPVV